NRRPILREQIRCPLFDRRNLIAARQFYLLAAILVAQKPVFGGRYAHPPKNRLDRDWNRRVILARAYFRRTRTYQGGSLPTPGDLLSPRENWKAGRNRTTGTHLFSCIDAH